MDTGHMASHLLSLASSRKLFMHYPCPHPPSDLFPASDTIQKCDGYENTVGASPGCPLTRYLFKVKQRLDPLTPNIVARAPIPRALRSSNPDIHSSVLPYHRKAMLSFEL